MSDGPLVQAEGLTKHYTTDTGLLDRLLGTPRTVRAVDGVDLSIRRGETLGLVGESGCGKTTLGRTLLRLTEPTAGTVVFDGEDVTAYDDAALREFRGRAQMIFQNPASSLNPRLTVADIVGEALDVHGETDDRAARVRELLDRVGLGPGAADRYPHEFSGGQRQRIGIARALAVDPDFVVCDEPVSALDVSVQAQILNLLTDLQAEFDLAYLFVAHDLSVVDHVADRVAVMYLGEIVDVGTPAELFAEPQHPYTEALLSAVPEPDPLWSGDRILLEGSVPSPADPPSGCRFHTRCPRVITPPDHDLGRAEWRALRSLRAALGGDGAETAADPDALRAAHGLPARLSDPEAEAILADALDAAARGDRAAARDRLATFESPCETHEPALRDVGAGRVACHRFDPAFPGGPDVEGGDGTTDDP